MTAKNPPQVILTTHIPILLITPLRPLLNPILMTIPIPLLLPPLHLSSITSPPHPFC